jgi:hypothetical protein
MNLPEILLTNSVVGGLVVPTGAVLLTAGWKVMASRNLPSPDDWNVGFDLLLAAAALQLTYLVPDYMTLRKELVADPFLKWEIALGWLLLLAVFGLCWFLGVIMKSVSGFWQPDEYWANVTGRYGPVQIYHWTLRPLSVFGINILGGSVLALIYLANAYPGYIYYHGPHWLQGI